MAPGKHQSHCVAMLLDRDEMGSEQQLAPRCGVSSVPGQGSLDGTAAHQRGSGEPPSPPGQASLQCRGKEKLHFCNCLLAFLGYKCLKEFIVKAESPLQLAKI